MRALLFILFTSLFIGCENDIQKVNMFTGHSNLPLQTAKNIEVLYSDSARVKVKLNAPVSQRFEDTSPYIEFPKGVKAIFYRENLIIRSTLTANYAMIKEKEGLMEAKGNVIIVNEKGEQLNTEKLTWDQNKAKVYTKEFVKITTSDKIIFGQGMEANEDFSVYRIFNIKGTITVKKDA